jgi:hypothetical protein
MIAAKKAAVATTARRAFVTVMRWMPLQYHSGATATA